jgi:hypothetical protein
MPEYIFEIENIRSICIYKKYFYIHLVGTPTRITPNV